MGENDRKRSVPQMEKRINLNEERIIDAVKETRVER